jgi:hypothetical protein
MSDIENKIRRAVIKKIAKIRAGRILAGSESRMEINPEREGDRPSRAGTMLAGGILDTPANGGVMLAGKRKRGGTLLIDDISSNPVIGGKRPQARKGAARGDGGHALAAYRAALDAYRARNPNVPYRQAQKIVARK